VGHTGASGFARLAHQARFVGRISPGQSYLLVDDFVGQGGTLANLIGYIGSQGGQVLGATVLTGKPYSAILAPDGPLIQALRDKHGRELEDWWNESFGFDFERLTRSEARYLEKTPDAHTIRDRIVAAGLEGGT
jgi:hypoxanthine-guanine phosphoribosyltransferase